MQIILSKITAKLIAHLSLVKYAKIHQSEAVTSAPPSTLLFRPTQFHATPSSTFIILCHLV